MFCTEIDQLLVADSINIRASYLILSCCLCYYHILIYGFTKFCVQSYRLRNTVFHPHGKYMVVSQIFGKNVELSNTLVICLNVGTWPLIHVIISKYVLMKNILSNFIFFLKYLSHVCKCICYDFAYGIIVFCATCDCKWMKWS